MKTQRQQNERILNRKMDEYPEYVMRFLRNNLGSKQPTSLLSYARDFEQFFEWLITNNYTKCSNIKEIPISVLNNLYRDDIEDFRVHLSTLRNVKGEPFANTTINRKLSSLKSLFNYLVKTESRKSRSPLLERNVMAQVPLLKIENSKDTQLETIRTTILVEEEIKAFREFIAHGYGELTGIKENKRMYNRWLENKERDVAIVALLLGSGLRIAELADITLSDLDKRERTVRVYRKSGRKRVVPYSPTAHTYLQHYLSLRNEKYKTEDNEDDALFVTKYQSGYKYMDKRSMQKMITKYASLFDKPRLTAHKLRHTFATNHMAKINNIPILQLLLDHSSPNTTMIYNDLYESDIHESIDRADV